MLPRYRQAGLDPMRRPAERFLDSTYRDRRAGADDGEGPANPRPAAARSRAAYCGRPFHEKAISFNGRWLSSDGISTMAHLTFTFTQPDSNVEHRRIQERCDEKGE